jgi:hypothetical protein
MRNPLYTQSSRIQSRAAMSVFDSFEERMVSPMKVAWNLAADVLSTGDFPSWKQIDSAFTKHDTSTLPPIELTNSAQSSATAAKPITNWDTAVQAASVNLSVSRASDPASEIISWQTGG